MDNNNASSRVTSPEITSNVLDKCADKVPFNILTAYQDDQSRQARETYSRLSGIARRNIREAEEAEELRQAAAIARQIDIEMPVDVVPNMELLVGDSREIAENKATTDYIAQFAIKKSNGNL